MTAPLVASRLAGASFGLEKVVNDGGTIGCGQSIHRTRGPKGSWKMKEWYCRVALLAEVPCLDGFSISILILENTSREPW